MISPMALELAFHYLSLASLTIPSASSIYLMSDKSFSLAFYIYFSSALSLCLISLYPSNRESSILSRLTAINSCYLRISSASLLTLNFS